VASAVGLGSPNYLQLVIQGKKNLSESTAERVAVVLKLSKSEVSYFLALVQKENAETTSEREKAERHLCVVRKSLIAKALPEEHQEVINEWYHLLVRELVFLKDFRPSGKYIAQKLNGLITEQEAEASLALLLRTGYIQEVEGHFEVQDPVIDTGLDIFTHKSMQKMHAKLLSVWAAKIADLGSAQQELGVLNIPLAGKDVAELQKRVRRFQDEIIGWAEGLQKDSEPDQVVQLGTYLMNYAGKD
jgi:uncharacterized protein (TIGR02147 family)